MCPKQYFFALKLLRHSLDIYKLLIQRLKMCWSSDAQWRGWKYYKKKFEQLKILNFVQEIFCYEIMKIGLYFYDVIPTTHEVPIYSASTI